jgi:hypothetical protein
MSGYYDGSANCLGVGEVTRRLYSYPARPSNGGNLMLSGAKKGWLYQPKINGWRAIFDASTEEVWNRHGKLLTTPFPAKGKYELLRLAEKTGWNWWDCELVERRTKLKGKIIVLDAMDADLPFIQRYLTIQSQFPTIHNGKPWEVLSALPTLESDKAEKLWMDGLAYNKSHGDELYEGVVAKKRDSIYPQQKITPDRVFPYWVKHRYAD